MRNATAEKKRRENRDKIKESDEGGNEGEVRNMNCRRPVACGISNETNMFRVQTT